MAGLCIVCLLLRPVSHASLGLPHSSSVIRTANVISECRSVCPAGEQLFHTGLLVGEALRLSFWVGDRQLGLPSGSAVMECKMQYATGQYQIEVGVGLAPCMPAQAARNRVACWSQIREVHCLRCLAGFLQHTASLLRPLLLSAMQEAWAKLLLEDLEKGSTLRAPYTLVLRRREVKDSVVHVDASLKAEGLDQNQWWRRLQKRLRQLLPTNCTTSLPGSHLSQA